MNLETKKILIRNAEKRKSDKKKEKNLKVKKSNIKPSDIKVNIKIRTINEELLWIKFG